MGCNLPHLLLKFYEKVLHSVVRDVVKIICAGFCQSQVFEAFVSMQCFSVVVIKLKWLSPAT